LRQSFVNFLVKSKVFVWVVGISRPVWRCARPDPALPHCDGAAKAYLCCRTGSNQRNLSTVAQEDPRFVCASWNVHRGKGNDGVTAPDRIRRVLAADVCAGPLDALILQEADADGPPYRGFLDLAQIEADTGLRHVQAAPSARWGAESHGFLGVIVFAHPSWQVQDVVLLDLPGHCHRGAVIVDLAREGVALRLVGTHLSLSQALRVVQMRTLGQHLFRRAPRQTVLCGDLNEWRPWGGLALSPRVSGLRFAGPARATFPVGRPILPLDRVLATAPARVVSATVLDSADIRMASDHRPIRAEVSLGGPDAVTR
jgi:endonuclease/exonuclease/phosphatase family metal-dependent hydrolase